MRGGFGAAGASAVGAALLALSGCAFGPLAVHTNRQCYNEAIRQTWNEEFLLNMVRLRYRDPPQFDAVTNILAAHTFNASLNASEQIRAHSSVVANLFNLFTCGGTAGISESPAITISPLEGAEFSRSLLGPVHLESIVLLSHTGWDMDRVLRLTVQDMNRLENVPFVSTVPERAPRFEEFTAVARWMRELQHRGLLELAYDDFERPLSEPWRHKDISASELVSATDKKLSFHRVSSDQIVLVGKERAPVLRIAPGAWDDFCGAARAAQILNLAPGLGVYRLIWGNETGQLKPMAVPGAELVLTTRSVLGVLILASKGVEVPPKHVEHGLATLPVDEHGQPFDWSLVTGDLIQVHYSKTKPLHAFVAVKYRGYWFYIDDDDPVSKSNFALVLEVFALELAGGIVPGPVVTVPVGTTGLQVAPATGGRRGGGGGGGGGTGGGGT